MKNKKAILIGLIILLIILAIVIYINTNKKNLNKESENIGHNGDMKQTEEINREEPVEYKNEVDIKDEDIKNSKNDKIALSIDEKTKGTITKTKVEKTGDSSNLSASDKSGWNSAIQVKSSSDITVKDVNVNTNGSGASGVVATGNNAVINISDTTITTNGQRSKGLLISKGGTIYGNKLNISTSGLKSSAVATDYGNGLIEIKNSTIRCSGDKSAGVYATSQVKVEDSNIESENSEGAVIDGHGEITFTNVEMTTHKKRAVMVYYTGPKMGDKTEGKFNMIKGRIDVKDGQGFYVMNTKATINLEKVEMNINSGIFLKASVDEYGELGQEGEKVESKGGDAVVNCVNQTIKGNILADNESTVELNFTKKSNYTGSINSENTGKKITLKIDKDSKITLTGDCYINSLEDEEKNYSNIDFNGYRLFVNGKAINS